jgi:hypothetical protein
MIMPSVMLLDAYYLPVREISVEHAVYLLFSGKAEPLYSAEGLSIIAQLGIAPSAEANWAPRFRELIVDGKFLVPAGIRLHRAIAFRLHNRRPTRQLILKRDRHTCQYCGQIGELTLDHVLPQSRGGGDTWENLVTACLPCNQRKADRTPDEAGMRLAKPPRRFTPSVYNEVMEKLVGCPA